MAVQPPTPGDMRAGLHAPTVGVLAIGVLAAASAGAAEAAIGTEVPRFLLYLSAATTVITGAVRNTPPQRAVAVLASVTAALLMLSRVPGLSDEAALPVIVVAILAGTSGLVIILHVRRRAVVSSGLGGYVYTDAIAASLPLLVLALTSPQSTGGPEEAVILAGDVLVLMTTLSVVMQPLRVPPALWLMLATTTTATLADSFGTVMGLLSPVATEAVDSMTVVFLAAAATHPTFARVAQARPTSIAKVRASRSAALAISLLVLVLVDRNRLPVDDQTDWVALTALLVVGGLLVLRLLELVRSATIGEQRALHQARTDQLTGLLNVEGLIRHAMSLPRPWTVVALDLDRFGHLNETLGVGVGDEVLVEVARRLRVSVGTDLAVARTDGNTFAVVVRGDTTAARDVAQHAQLAISEPVAAAGIPGVVAMTASVGLAAADVGTDVRTVLNRATVAAGRAKEGGRGRMVAFTQRMVNAGMEDAGLLLALQRCLSDHDGHLWPNYQPIVDLVTGEVVAVESLARWSCPDTLGVNLQHVIDLAEKTGLITEVGRRLTTAALAGLATVRRSYPEARLHLNASPTEMQESDFVDHLVEAIDMVGLKPHDVVVEVTEQVLLPRSSEALHNVLKVSARGIGLALDDFGSGYASIAYLGSLPLETVKLDKRFTVGIGGTANLAPQVLRFLLSLDITVIAEGIETPEHGKRVAELGCHLGQGWALGRPQPAEAFGEPATARLPWV